MFTNLKQRRLINTNVWHVQATFWVKTVDFPKMHSANTLLSKKYIPFWHQTLFKQNCEGCASIKFQNVRITTNNGLVTASLIKSPWPGTSRLVQMVHFPIKIELITYALFLFVWCMYPPYGNIHIVFKIQTIEKMSPNIFAGMVEIMCVIET